MCQVSEEPLTTPRMLSLSFERMPPTIRPRGLVAEEEGATCRRHERCSTLQGTVSPRLTRSQPWATATLLGALPRRVCSSHRHEASSALKHYGCKPSLFLLLPPSLTPSPSDWDAQRASFLSSHPGANSTASGSPKLMMVSGSGSEPCGGDGDFLLLLFLKNKQDYARAHALPFYHAMGALDPRFTGFWVKVALLHAVMRRHPEVEWFWWIDADAMITGEVGSRPEAEGGRGEEGQVQETPEVK